KAGNYFFIQAEDGIRDFHVTGVQTCALPISSSSDTPVTLVSEASQLLTSCAASASATAAKTTGMDLVLATTTWAEGVAMATITSGLSPTNLRAIWPAVAVLPWAVWYCHFRLSPTV